MERNFWRVNAETGCVFRWFFLLVAQLLYNLRHHWIYVCCDKWIHFNVVTSYILNKTFLFIFSNFMLYQSAVYQKRNNTYTLFRYLKFVACKPFSFLTLMIHLIINYRGDITILHNIKIDTHIANLCLRTLSNIKIFHTFCKKRWKVSYMTS